MSLELRDTAFVARVTGKHRKTVERAIRRGALRATRLSGAARGRYGVKDEWIEDWINGCTVEPAQPPAVPPMPGSTGRPSGGTLTLLPTMGRDRKDTAA